MLETTDIKSESVFTKSTRTKTEQGFKSCLRHYGQYQIVNTGINRYYIGISINIDARLSSHARKLMTNKHDNVLLQEDYNELLSKNLNPFDILQVRIIKSTLYTSKTTKEETQKLSEKLRKEELEMIKNYFDKGLKLYNMEILGFFQSLRKN